MDKQLLAAERNFDHFYGCENLKKETFVLF